MNQKIGFGGGCHWCTEAVFLSLKGVQNVAQGWIASQYPNDAFSEAVVVDYNDAMISLEDLTEIHLHTHASTSLHSMRDKYRSAVYVFDEEQERGAKQILWQLQAGFEQTIITKVLPYAAFKPSLQQHLNYYYTDPERPFCETYINQKIQLLKNKFENLTKVNMVSLELHA